MRTFALLILAVFLLGSAPVGFALGSQVKKVTITHSHSHEQGHDHHAHGHTHKHHHHHGHGSHHGHSHKSAEKQTSGEESVPHSHEVMVCVPGVCALPSASVEIFVPLEKPASHSVSRANPPREVGLGSIFRPPIS